MTSAGQSPPGTRIDAEELSARQRKAEAESSGEDESSEDAAESSSDEDQQPLAQRGWAAKHALPQPTAPARTRNNRYPNIPKSERCGTCENCMNPQRKKACVVARRRMEERQQQKQGGGKDGAAPAPAAVAEDPFTRSLTGILSSSGGVVQERHLALLLQLIKRAQTKPHRTALLVVLQLSAPEVLRRAVAGRVLLDLQLWLSDFVAEGSQPMVQKTLACLNKLPVTLAALQPPCELGKLVGRLRKHPSFGSPVIEPAKRLVARWKAMVDEAVKAGGGGGDAIASAPPSKPGAAAAKPAPPPAKPVAAAGSATLERQASGNVAVMADGDLFGTTDRQRSGVKDAVPATKKSVTIKTIAVEAIAGKPENASQSAAAAPGATGKAAGAVSGKPGSGSSAAATTAGQAGLSKVGASPFAVLGSTASGVTMLGGSSSGSLGMPLSTVGPSSSSAKDRAAAAARRVPSPEPQPQPRKEKKKKVVWVDAEAPVGVRWFLKDDPPAAAQQDADLAQAPAAGSSGAAAAMAASAVAPEAQPPGFESAAKKEHLSEAQALRRHRAEEDQDRIELEQRLALMVPTTAWLSPLPNDCMSDADPATMPPPPARGEGSLEAAEAAGRRQQVPAALYASAAAIPESPAEPGALADHGMAQHPADIPHIPLTLEEAADMQQQQQAMAAADALGRQQLAQHLPAQQQQLQQQQSQIPVADIGAALAQLAASGVLAPVGGGPLGGGQSMQRQQQQQQQPPQPQPQPAMRQGQQVPGHNWWQQGSQQHQQHQQQLPYQGQQHAGPAPPQRRFHNQRACHYFSTPKGCFHGDRCKFAHIAPSSGTGGGGVKRSAEGDAGVQHNPPSKHQRL